MPSLYAYKVPTKQNVSPLLAEDSDPEVHNLANNFVKRSRRAFCLKLILALGLTLLFMSGIIAITYYLGGFTRTIRIIHTGTDDQIAIQSDFNPDALGSLNDYSDASPASIEYIPDKSEEESSGVAPALSAIDSNSFKYQRCYDNVFIYCPTDQICNCPPGITASVGWIQSTSSDISLNLNRQDSDLGQLDRDLETLREGNWAELSVTSLCVALCSPDFIPIQVQCEKLMSACEDHQK